MQAKTFRALGREGVGFFNPLALLSLLAGVPLYILAIAERGGFVDWGTFVYWLPLTGVLFLASMVGFFVVSRRTSTGVNEYEVTISDSRDSGGRLQLSYHQLAGRRSRNSLAVKKVESYPNRPLMRAVMRHEEAVRGTSASLSIDFEKTALGITFGFPSESEMNDVFSLLKE